MAYDTHIICFTSIVFHAFDHFASQLGLVGLMIQNCKFVTTWFTSTCLNFSFHVGFYTPLDNIKVLGIPFGSPSFAFFFIQYALDDNVCHVEALLSLRNILVAFGILFWCFIHLFFSLFFWNPFLEFQHQLAYFDLTFIEIFKRLLGASFLECLEALFN